MGHVIEPAASGRAKCRGCAHAIAKGELRFGERLPNPYGDGDGEMTLWFHLVCAAYKRPASLREALDAHTDAVPERERLGTIIDDGLAHRRVPRVDGAERAPTGRARCRQCREMIEKDAWRIRLVYFDEVRFEPSGFIHARCAADYLETTDVVARARHFTAELGDDDAAAFAAALVKA